MHSFENTSAVCVRPQLTIRPSSGWPRVPLRQLWHFRDLLITLGARDIRLRYKQTALGIVWVLFQPLMAAGIFSFVFGTVAKLPSDGVPYFIFSYAGLLGWNLFNNVLARSSTSLTGNATLVSKAFFPRMILPLSTIYSAVIDFLVALGMFAIVLALYGLGTGPQILLLPVWLLLILMLSVGMGLLSAALMVSYRDVGYVLPVLTQLLLYASPVAYAVSAVPENLRPAYFINPLTGLFEAMRWSLLGQSALDWSMVGWSALCASVVFLGGALLFGRLERRFADVI
jgi:lipopolysaccharide transport system permease protein